MYDVFRNLLILTRPKQWVKNGFILAPLFFSLSFSDNHTIISAFLAVISFTFLCAACYIINDFFDIERDRSHPKKSSRPLACGTISVPLALSFSAMLLTISFTLLTFFLPTACLYIALAYLVQTTIYSYKLKHIAILDVLLIANGFILRLWMGSAATSIALSPWIIITTFLLALFLGYGKRRQELIHHNTSQSRHSLDGYTIPLLDMLIAVTCSTTLISYAIYAIEVGQSLAKPELVYSCVFVIFGLLRYVQTLYVKQSGEEPESILYTDPVFTLNIVAWLAVTLSILA